MQDVWMCAAPGLAPLHAEAQALARGFERVTYVHIRRELNSLADELANAAMDSRQDAEELLQDVHEAYTRAAQEQEEVI
jgi:ribonuclease HI